MEGEPYNLLGLQARLLPFPDLEQPVCGRSSICRRDPTAAMKLQPDFAPDTQMVSAYGPGYVEVNGVRQTHACVFAPQQAPKPWGAEQIDALQASHIDALLFDPLPEVVLIGTGREQHMLTPALMRPLMAKRIGWEVMDTAAACRTYNILAGEGRQVLAALMIE